MNLALADDWQVCRVTVPVRTGPNLLSLQFGRTNADGLSAQFSLAGFTEDIAPQPLVRIAAARRGTGSPADPSFVARLGFDPQSTRASTLELAQTLVPQLFCLDDAQFIERAYELLTGRRVETQLARDYRNALKLGMMRGEAIRRMVRSR